MMSAFSRAAILVVKLLAPAGLLLAGGSVSHAGDVKTGSAKAMMCQASHGLDGLSKTPDAPSIAGQIEPYLVAQLQAFIPADKLAIVNAVLGVAVILARVIAQGPQE